MIIKISPNCKEMVIHCTWEDKEEDCREILETEATDDGYCCSFNSLVLNSKKSVSKPYAFSR